MNWKFTIQLVIKPCKYKQIIFKHKVAQVSLEKRMITIKEILQRTTINFSFELIKRNGAGSLRKHVEQFHTANFSHEYEGLV